MSSSDIYSEDDDELSDTPSVTPRAARGTRAKALKNLRSPLPQAAVESYSSLLDRTFWEPKIGDTFNATQNGIVIWSPHEKRTLFEVLDKNGLNGIREIAAAIGSKSELEVQEYIRLLQKGVRRQHLNDGHSRTVVLGEIPAAAEISEDCCKSLDDYAEVLCLEEQRREDATGRRKHGNLWIIDKEVAEELEANTAENDDDGESSEVDHEVAQINGPQAEPATTPDVKSATTFFKLTKWILLSERFFMNFGGRRLEDNWVNVAFKDETPSMTADAVTDFYDIALSATRRLVQAAQFFATSRVRRHESATVVRASDVRSAARTLDMKPDTSDYWIGLARRCSLDVQDIRHKKGWEPIPLDHDEVEDLLSHTELPEEPYGATAPNSSPPERSSSISSVQSADSLDEDSDDVEDDHAEAVDHQHGLAEELLCWSAIGQQPPESFKSDSLDHQIPPKPSGKRKAPEELVDWRDRILYRSEWEEFGYEAGKLESEFENQRKKRRSKPSSKPSSFSEPIIQQPSSDIESPKSQNGREHSGMHKNPETESELQTDESDPEFNMESTRRTQISKLNPKPKSKSKQAVSRTSSRKRTPVSYAVPPLSEFDMEMEIDVDSESEHDSSKSHGPENHQTDLERIDGGGDGDQDDDT
ncbi:hypothetical protein BDV18DRAFT_145340 [Aspergillus unguis]